MRTASLLTGIFLCFLTLVSNGQGIRYKGAKVKLKAEIDSILQSQVENNKTNKQDCYRVIEGLPLVSPVGEQLSYRIYRNKHCGHP